MSLVTKRRWLPVIKTNGGRALRPLRRLGDNQDGFTAVEFALVIIPFLATMFAIMEVSLVYFATFTLENATEQAARLIRTGQAQQTAGGFDEDDFKEAVCSSTMAFMSCNENLRVDVRTFANFADVAGPQPIDENGEMSDDFESFNMGAGGAVVLVTVYYKWGVVASWPRLGLGVGNMDDGSRLISAAVAFRNEPFDG